MIKKLGNYSVTSNMKKVPLLRGYELSDKQLNSIMDDINDEDEKELLENDYFLQMHGKLLTFDSFNNASFDLFKAWIDEKYHGEMDENKIILYICNGMNFTVVGAVVISLYDETVSDNGHFVIYKFKL